MTKIFYDTEFLEDGKTIDLISIGLISEAGDEYYACNLDANWKRINKHEWLRENVLPSLPRIHGDRRLSVSVRKNPVALDYHDRRFKSHATIADEVRQFLQSHPDVELWADYCAYDHVALCQLWGPMIALPEGIPMFTHDFQHELDRLGRPTVPEQKSGHHNALDDARHLRESFLAVQS